MCSFHGCYHGRISLWSACGQPVVSLRSAGGRPAVGRRSACGRPVVGLRSAGGQPVRGRVVCGSCPHPFSLGSLYGRPSGRVNEPLKELSTEGDLGKRWSLIYNPCGPALSLVPGHPKCVCHCPTRIA